LEKAANNDKMKEAVFYKSQKSIMASDQRLIEVDFEQIKQEAFECLSPKRRIIFEMSREKRMRYDEIATELGISESTVKTQMSKALKKMRNFLNKHQDVPFIFYMLAESLFELIQ
jgi:RNA polymerase sigma-70 factor (ECF subfamily)